MKQSGEKKGGMMVVVILIIVAVLISVLIQRGGDDGQVGDGGGTEPIVIGVPNWESAMGTAYILREMIEKNFAVETRLQSGTNEEIYTGIADGTVHIHPEGWIPNHDDWHAKFANALERNKYGVNAIQGLCVDKALAKQYTITHIKDLLNPGIAQYFDSDGDGRGEAWVGAEGWGATTVERIRAKSYGYDAMFELLEMDESAALERLRKATSAGKLFALYCYTPHSMWRVHNLYRLKEPTYSASKWKVVFPSEDPKWLEKSNAAVAWKPAKLHIYYAKSLEKHYPEVARFIKKTRFTMDELLQIAYDLETGKQDFASYAQQWVAKNR